MSSLQQSPGGDSQQTPPPNASGSSVPEHAMYGYSNANRIVKNQAMLSGNPYVNVNSLSSPNTVEGYRNVTTSNAFPLNSEQREGHAVVSNPTTSPLNRQKDVVSPGSRPMAMLSMPSHTGASDPSAFPNNNRGTQFPHWQGSEAPPTLSGNQGQGQGISPAMGYTMHGSSLSNREEQGAPKWDYYGNAYGQSSDGHLNRMHSVDVSQQSTGGGQTPQQLSQGMNYNGHSETWNMSPGYPISPYYAVMGPNGGPVPPQFLGMQPMPGLQTHAQQLASRYGAYGMHPFNAIQPQNFYGPGASVNSNGQGYQHHHQQQPGPPWMHQMEPSLNHTNTNKRSLSETTTSSQIPNKRPRPNTSSDSGRPPAQMPRSSNVTIDLTRSSVSPGKKVDKEKESPVEPAKPRAYDPEALSKDITKLFQSKKSSSYLAEEYCHIMKSIDKDSWAKNVKEEFEMGLQLALKFGSPGFWAEMKESLGFVARMRNWIVAMLRGKKGSKTISALQVLEALPVTWEQLESSKFPAVLNLLEKKGDDNVQMLAKRVIAHKKQEKERLERQRVEKEKKEKEKEKTKERSKKNDAAASSFGFFKDLQTSNKPDRTPVVIATKSAADVKLSDKPAPVVTTTTTPATTTSARSKTSPPVKAAPLLFSGKMSLKNQLERKDEAKNVVVIDEKENAPAPKKKKKTVSWRDDNLVEIREFEAEYDTGLKSAYDAKRLDIDEAQHALHQPEAPKEFDWYTPVAFTIEEAKSSFERNSIRRGGLTEIESPEAKIQSEREAHALVEVYHDMNDIPATPKEPVGGFNSLEDSTKPVLIRRPQEIEDHPLVNQLRPLFEQEQEQRQHYQEPVSHQGLSTFQPVTAQPSTVTNSSLTDILARLASHSNIVNQTKDTKDTAHPGPSLHEQLGANRGPNYYGNRRDNDAIARRQQDVRQHVREATGSTDQWLQPCRYFERGLCKRGDYCTYLHLKN